MNQVEWRSVLAARDQLMLACWLGSVGFALNWYVWPGARRFMAWAAVVIVIVSVSVRLVWR